MENRSPKGGEQRRAFLQHRHPARVLRLDRGRDRTDGHAHIHSRLPRRSDGDRVVALWPDPRGIPPAQSNGAGDAAGQQRRHGARAAPGHKQRGSYPLPSQSEAADGQLPKTLARHSDRCLPQRAAYGPTQRSL